MTTIVVTNEANEVDEFKFEIEQRSISLGRRTTNDVHIPDLSVSGTHAVITIADGVATLSDLNSTNGTYINGQVVQKSVIQPADEVMLGKVSVSVSVPSSGNSVTDTPAHAKHTPEAVAGKPASAEVTAQDVSQSGIINGELAPEHSTKSAAPEQNSSAGTHTHAAVSSGNEQPHPLDGLEHVVIPGPSTDQSVMHELDSPATIAKGAVIEIKNGKKSGQILPIDKPITTLGRPGIQIAAIMNKPDGYFLMHIESDDNVDRPTLNKHPIDEEPVLLNSGDKLNVAGIDVEFMLS